jgi:hypothetical protein
MTMTKVWAGSSVHTKRGWIPAYELIVGDEVLALDGSWASVTATDLGTEDCFAVQAASGIRVTTPQEITGEVDVEGVDGQLFKEHAIAHHVGDVLVCHIECGSKAISAGDAQGFGIFVT